MHEENKTALAVKQFYSFDKWPISNLSTFYELALNSNVFVDKSLLIKELIDDNSKIVLITRPKGWGKSTNLDMIRSFFSITVDKHDKPITPAETKAYSLFVYGQFYDQEKKSLREPLLISKHKTIIDKYLGQYPVIYVDMEGVFAFNYADMLGAINAKIRPTFVEHKFLVRKYNATLEKGDTQILEKIILEKRQIWFDDILYRHKKNEIVLEHFYESLKFLAKMLKEHYEKKVLILMDNYDYPIHFVLKNSFFSSQDRDSFIVAYTRFLTQTFRENEYMLQGVLTGTFPPTMNQTAYGLRAMAQYTLLDSNLNEFFGFNEAEIQQLNQLLRVSNETRIHFKNYYGGYQILNSSSLLYNPWSIVHHLSGGNETWIEDSAMYNLLQHFLQCHEFPSLFHALLDDNNKEHFISKSCRFKLDLEHYRMFYELMQRPVHEIQFDRPFLQKLTLQYVNQLLMFLYNLGYLTTNNATVTHTHSENNSSIARFTRIYLKFPNYQVKELMKEIISDYNEKLLRKFSEA